MMNVLTKGGFLPPVKTEDWKPKHEQFDYPQEFVDWINSINSGWQNKKEYEPFNLYVRQANEWLMDPTKIDDYDNEEDQLHWLIEEIERCKENTLYFCNKYGRIKEDTAEGGSIPYIAWEPQQVLLFLFDCGYSMMIGKARQVGFTTTLTLAGMKRVNLNKSYFAKFITHSDAKGKEIFDDKVKWAFTKIPEYIARDVKNWTQNTMAFDRKGNRKGRDDGAGSKFQVVPPAVDAINGGSPSLVMVDEIGLFGIFGQMMREGRPALLKYNPKTGKLFMQQQFLAWGCVCAGTKVYSSDGRVVNIEELKQEDGIIGYDGKGHSKEPILWMKPPAKKPCYRITTEGGNVLECSHDHPLLRGHKHDKSSYNTKNLSFIKAEEVKVGDQLMMIGDVPVFGNKMVNDARMLGLMVGDGHYGLKSTPQLSISEKDIYDYVFENYDAKTYRVDNDIHHKVGISNFMDVLRDHGMYGQSKMDKELPSDIDQFDEKSLCEFLGGYFDADGNIREKGNSVGLVLTSVSYKLLKAVKFQLLKLGIHCSIHKENRNGERKISEGQQPFIYRLYINNQYDVAIFQKKIKLLNKEKQARLDQVLNYSGKKFRVVEKGNFVPNDNGKGKHFLGMNDMSGMRSSVVKKIEYIGEKEIYNLTAGATHTYIANGFVTHNTGGEMDKGGAVYEQEFKACLKEWRAGNYEYGIIPLFFNAYARPGVTKEYLDKEIRAYVMNQESQNADVAKVQFYQAYPIVIEHMFLRKARTMIPISTCIEHGERIYTEDKITWGYFEPILDYSQPKPDLFVPYRIIGAKFIPTRDEFDVNTTVCIRTHPVKGEVWKWRFFQGTDPINSETGHSKMSSTVWDALTNSIAATVFTRDRNFKNSYLQCLLLRLYYDPKGTEGIPELIENNIGDMYLDFQEQLGFKRNIVSNMSLSPEYFRKPNGKWFGLANKVDTAPRILGKMQEMVDCHAANLDIPWLWKQFETFVEKDLNSASTHRQTRYQAADMRYDYDDVLFSTTFAYINAMSHAKYEPTNLNDDSLQRKVFTRRVQNRQTNFIPKMAEVDERGNIIRIL